MTGEGRSQRQGPPPPHMPACGCVRRGTTNSPAAPPLPPSPSPPTPKPAAPVRQRLPARLCALLPSLQPPHTVSVSSSATPAATNRHNHDPQVADLLAFKFKNSVVMAYGSSGAGKTHTIEVCVCEGGAGVGACGFLCSCAPWPARCSSARTLTQQSSFSTPFVFKCLVLYQDDVESRCQMSGRGPTPSLPPLPHTGDRERPRPAAARRQPHFQGVGRCCMMSNRMRMSVCVHGAHRPRECAHAPSRQCVATHPLTPPLHPSLPLPLHNPAPACPTAEAGAARGGAAQGAHLLLRGGQRVRGGLRGGTSCHVMPHTPPRSSPHSTAPTKARTHALATPPRPNPTPPHPAPSSQHRRCTTTWCTTCWAPPPAAAAARLPLASCCSSRRRGSTRAPAPADTARRPWAGARGGVCCACARTGAATCASLG